MIVEPHDFLAAEAILIRAVEGVVIGERNCHARTAVHPAGDAATGGPNLTGSWFSALVR